MNPEGEVSIYQCSAALAEEGRHGMKGTSDRVEIGLRESRRPGAKEVEAYRVVP